MQPPESAHLPEALPEAGPEKPARSPVHCRLCGRPLRGRAAKRWGLGAGCRRKLLLRAAPRPPAAEVDQDPLPGL